MLAQLEMQGALSNATWGSSHDGGELLGGSWVVISRVIHRVTILVTRIQGLI